MPKSPRKVYTIGAGSVRVTTRLTFANGETGWVERIVRMETAPEAAYRQTMALIKGWEETQLHPEVPKFEDDGRDYGHDTRGREGLEIIDE